MELHRLQRRPPPRCHRNTRSNSVANEVIATSSSRQGKCLNNFFSTITFTCIRRPPLTLIKEATRLPKHSLTLIARYFRLPRPVDMVSVLNYAKGIFLMFALRRIYGFGSLGSCRGSEAPTRQFISRCQGPFQLTGIRLQPR